MLLALALAPLTLTALRCGEPTTTAREADVPGAAASKAGSDARPPDQTLDALRLAGVAGSAEEVRIHSQVDGTATHVMVRDGDTVKAGDTLVLLANPDLVSRAEQATATHGAAGSRAQAADVDSRMSALERATSLSISELDYQGAQVSAEIDRHVSRQIVENDQAKNMAFSLTDVERSQSSLLRARNRLRQAQLRHEASKARGASVALNLSKTERERQRMEELLSKNFASASAVEEAQLAYANALSRSEEYKRDLAARDEDVKGARDEVASAQARVDIWEEALGHGVTSLQAMKDGREAIHTRVDQTTERTGVRLEATRAVVGLDAERTAHFAAASLQDARNAEAAAQVAGQQVEWLRVVAPSDGVVVGLNVTVGEFVRSARSGADAGEPLLTLADPDRLLVRAPVKASLLANVVVGESVDVSSAGGAGASAAGNVASVSAIPGDHAAYIATIALSDPGDIRIGSVVQLVFP